MFIRLLSFLVFLLVFCPTAQPAVNTIAIQPVATDTYTFKTCFNYLQLKLALFPFAAPACNSQLRRPISISWTLPIAGGASLDTAPSAFYGAWRRSLTRAMVNLRHSTTTLPFDVDGQVSSTLRMMAEFAIEDSKRPEIIASAAAIASKSYDLRSLTQNLWEAVREKMIFSLDQDTARAFANQELGLSSSLAAIPDPENVVEVLIRPIDVELLYANNQRQVQGDCDDFSMYGASLLIALRQLGFPISNVRFVTVASSGGQQAGEYSHVYVRFDFSAASAAYGGQGETQTVALDSSHGPFGGWEVDSYSRIQEYPVDPVKHQFAFFLTASVFAFFAFRRLRRSRSLYAV